MTTTTVISFYRFFQIEEPLEQTARSLNKVAESCGVTGLLILANEGVNGTVSAYGNGIEIFEDALRKRFGLGDQNIKRATSDSPAFKRFKVKIRDEIVTTGSDSPLEVIGKEEGHLSPEEWHSILQSEEDYELIDTRNWYETDLGKFKGASDPRLVNFQEFSGFVESSEIPKSKKVLMYCTGGIRCEKASILMREKGYENVFQLQGGILKYLEEFPEGEFEGECFVFDKRVSVDKDLKPSRRYALCPHSGQPGANEIECVFCGKMAKVSDPCLSVPSLRTCSKDCANRYEESR